MRLARAAALLTATLVLTSCGAVLGTAVDKTRELLAYPVREWLFLGAFEHDNDWDEPYAPLPVERDHGEVIVGVTFSGGGSRSAYFSACVLEELGKHRIPGTNKTYLEELDYVGGVSGGSLAATYFCANRRREGYPQDDAAFFARMKEDMALDFELRAFGRAIPLLPLFAVTHYDLGDVFAAVWDANFLDGLTYGDLHPTAPVLVVSATCYNNGQKFVFTRLPMANEHPEGLLRIYRERQLTSGWADGYEVGATMTMETIDSSIAHCPLSRGVAASAAVPGLLKVTTFYDRTKDQDIFLGDGGVYDNHGTEALLQAMNPACLRNPGKPVIALVVDAAGFFSAGERAGRLDTLAGFTERTASISWLRATSYAEATLRLSQRFADELELSYLKRVLVQVISLYDDEALSAEVEDRTWAAELVNTLRGVGTRFSISSDAVEAIDLASPRVVSASVKRLDPRLRRVQEALKTRGTPGK